MNTMKVEVVVPNWVNWIAQDDDGEWRGHENKPFLQSTYWQSHGNIQLIAEGAPSKNWKEELYTWG